MRNLERSLRPFSPKGHLRVIVETPKGSRNKIGYDPTLRLFRLSKMLPRGFAFPFDFGFVPGTLAADGDPLDALLLIEEPVPVGCLVEARPIGLIREQKDGKANHRVVAVALADPLYEPVTTLGDLPQRVVEDLSRFFQGYADARGERARVRGHGGREEAMGAIRQALHRRAREQARADEERRAARH